MRVLTVTGLFPRRTAPTHGVFVLQRVKAVSARGAEVRVLSPLPWVPPGPVPARYAALRATPAADEREGIAVSYPRYPMVPKLGMRWQARGYAWGLRRRLRAEVAGFRPDVLDVHYLYPDAVGTILAARGLGVPVVCTARGSDVNVLARFPPVARRIRRALAEAAATLAVSRDLAATMQALGLVRGPVDVVPNGVDRERFRPRPRGEARRALGLPEAGRFVVCVGHLTPTYGQDVLVRALARPGTPEDLAVRLVGDGPDRASLEALARSLGVAGRVHFAGSVPHADVPLWLAASDGAVQLNRSAGSPNAVLEALACGIPVLASDIAAMREAVAEGAGLLVPRDPARVAEALARLPDHPAPPSDGVAGWDDVADRLLAVFRRVAGARDVAAAGSGT